MTKNIFKRTAVAMALASTVFAGAVSAKVTSFESDYTNEIHGLQPIFESIGAVIFKKNAAKPYAAKDFEGKKTEPQVGDTLYVPVNFLAKLAEDVNGAYSPEVYTFDDWDLDPEDGKAMAVTVEWYVLDATDESFEGKTPVATQVEANTYGVPYIVQPQDLGKKIGFRVTPVTKYGLPLIGTPVDVVDISKLAGQAYPKDENGNPKVDENGKPLPIIPNPDTNGTDNPNIGGEIVKVGNDLYFVRVVNSNGKFMDGKSTDLVPYVNATYTAQVFKKLSDTEYEDVSNDPAIKNNIVWKLYNPNQITVDGKHTAVVSTGIATGAVGADDLREDPNFKEVIDAKADITGRVSNGTLSFTTQVKNDTALYRDKPQFSEQGLQLKAVLIADDGQ